MLTEIQIKQEATRLLNDDSGTVITNQEAEVWRHGATWANEQAAAEIAELQAVNSEQADKIVDLQTRRDEHLRTIVELMGEKAELTTALNSALNIIRANGLHTEAHAKFFVAATDVVEKHSAK